MSIILSDPPWENGNARFTTVPIQNLNLINNVEDSVVFPTRKLFISVSFL